MPRLYYIPESEFNDDLTTAGSLVTLKDISYKFDSMIEEVPFQWAQALHIITRLTSKYCGPTHKSFCYIYVKDICTCEHSSGSVQ